MTTVGGRIHHADRVWVWGLLRREEGMGKGRKREREKGGEIEKGGENGRKEGEESEWSLSLKVTAYSLHDPLYQGVPGY